MDWLRDHYHGRCWNRARFLVAARSHAVRRDTWGGWVGSWLYVDR